LTPLPKAIGMIHPAVIAGLSASKTRVNALTTRQSIRLDEALFSMDATELGQARSRLGRGWGWGSLSEAMLARDRTTPTRLAIARRRRA